MPVIDTPAAPAVAALSPLERALLALLAAPDDAAFDACVAEHADALQFPGAAGLRLADGLALGRRRCRHAALQALQHRIAELASASSGVAAFYSGVHGVISASSGRPGLEIALLSDDDEWLHFPYCCGPGSRATPVGRPLARGLVEYVLRIGRPLLVDRTDPARTAQIETLQACGEIDSFEDELVAWVGVPLVSGERTLGVLAAWGTSSAAVPAASVQELLGAVSWPIANGIERLLRRATERQAAARLEARVAALEEELDRRLG
jgi:GAF domain-containing protein